MLNRDSRSKFCNSSCAAKYNNSKRLVNEETKEKISTSLKEYYPYQQKTTHKKAYSLKERLFRTGIKEYKCEACGISVWQGKPISLQLHHINGNRHDNKLENLQILCPNCHSQTNNYCHKNRKEHNKQQQFFCKNCGKELTEERKSGLCRECYIQSIELRGKRPSKEILEKEFNQTQNYSALAKKYNVCVRTIRKWLLKYGLI